MKRTILAVAIVLALVVPSIAYAVDAYQVTGTVTDFDKDKSITVLKGKEKFEISIDRETKIEGEVKKDHKVTVKYKMTATSIEGKEEGKKDKDKKESKKKS
jgi:hypothetical protein